MSDDRLALLEAKVAFICQVIALTKTQSDGTRVTKPLGAVFEETHAHPDSTPTVVPAAALSRAKPDVRQSVASGPGPDGTP